MRIVKKLIGRGADVNTVDESGSTILDYFVIGICKVTTGDKNKIKKLKECLVMLIKGGINKEKIYI